MSLGEIEEIELSGQLFRDKLTAIFGSTKSGKTIIVTDILGHLYNWADQIIVISPTNPQNKSYTGIVPHPLIHLQISDRLLNDLWERQEAMQAIYTRANNINVLRQLFNKCATSEIKRDINKIFGKLGEIKASLRGDEDEIKKVEEDWTKFIAAAYRDTISKYRGRLVDLSPDEQFVLKYIDFNPRIVLIFDDCTDDIKRFRRHKVIQKLFYQGRHTAFTTIIAAHSEKALDPELRKNVFTTILAEPQTANSYIDKEFKPDKELYLRAQYAIKVALNDPDRPYQKLMYIREERKFYRFTANKRKGFRFCSPVVWSFCDRVARDASDLPQNNKFMQEFL